jgi:hypothetical protein
MFQTSSNSAVKVDSRKKVKSSKWWLPQSHTGSFCLITAKRARASVLFSGEMHGYLQQARFKS